LKGFLKYLSQEFEMMKKSLIALAVLAASSTAFAGADVYGQARISIDKATNGKMTMADRVSRVGIKGTEDLGGGMSAVYGMEWDLDLNDNAETSGPFSGRNAFVGLKGAFGTVLAGKHDTPYKLAGSADLFADTAADSQGSTGIIGYGNFDLRATNALAYISPDFAGFHVAAAVTNNGASATALTDSKSLALVYVNGPLKATYGYEKHGALTLSSTAETGNKFNVAYKIGDIGLGYTYEKQDRSGTASDSTNQLASVSFGMGPITLAAQYGNRDYKTAATDLKRSTVGVVYALSKRTNTAVAYNHDDANGTKTNTTTVQLNHSF
jgi:predicted porin